MRHVTPVRTDMPAPPPCTTNPFFPPAQVIYDESEPRTVLISCHDDRRYLLDFQNAEENLVFRWGQ